MEEMAQKEGMSADEQGWGCIGRVVQRGRGRNDVSKEKDLVGENVFKK